jgi:hypothetical protein
MVREFVLLQQLSLLKRGVVALELHGQSEWRSDVNVLKNGTQQDTLCYGFRHAQSVGHELGTPVGIALHGLMNLGRLDRDIENHVGHSAMPFRAFNADSIKEGDDKVFYTPYSLAYPLIALPAWRVFCMGARGARCRLIRRRTDIEQTAHRCA